MWKLAAPNLSELPGIAHGFFGRRGGSSSGIYASLNCGPGSGDVRSRVEENRRRAMAALTAPECRLVTLYQIHGAEGVLVHEPWEVGNAPRADAMATSEPGIALGILTADCAPILLADAEAHVIGAAHSGWKGAVAGVIEQAVLRMEQLGAKRERIAAAIGPCISQSAYEVRDEFRAAFAQQDAANTRFFAPAARPGHWQFDLPGYASVRLQAAGVRNTASLAHCTYGEAEDFYSYRRATHCGETDYGRQLSAILLV
ncbi:MAG TPA: peptidoglycan editing factor PgeF [Rhizomicrobium sp.]|nr:peptidoglycan editing factor PgeF [Rhizomicrobium sp.]